MSKIIIGFYKFKTKDGHIRWFVRIFDGRGTYKKELDEDILEYILEA